LETLLAKIEEHVLPHQEGESDLAVAFNDIDAHELPRDDWRGHVPAMLVRAWPYVPAVARRAIAQTAYMAAVGFTTRAANMAPDYAPLTDVAGTTFCPDCGCLVVQDGVCGWCANRKASAKLQT
jgi:hypothetical protein